MAANNISTLAINVTMQGNQAEQGLNKLGSAMDGLKSRVDELANLGKGVLFFELGKKAIGLVNDFNEFLKTADRMSHQLGVMAGNISRGSQAFNSLNMISATSVATIESLTKGFEGLSGAGIGFTDSLDVLEKAGKMDWAFGGDGKGVDAITGGIAKMNSQLAASAEAFDLMRSKGVDAYQSLGKLLGTNATEAEKLLKSGKVTGFQGTQALMQSLNTKAAQQVQGKGEVGLLPSDFLNPMNWKKLFVEGPMGGFGGAFDAKIIRDAATKQAEAMKALAANMESVRFALEKDLAPPIQGVLDQLSLLDSQAKLAGNTPEFQDVVKLIGEKKAKLVESFAQVPLTAYEALGKQAQDIREQIAKALAGGQGDLADKLKERLKGLTAEGSTASGPFDTIAEKLQKLRGQYDQASGKFGGSEISAKFAQDQKALLDQLVLKDDSPFAALQDSLQDLDAAAKRLRSFNMAPDKYLQAREELAKREQKLVADYERSVMDPVLTEGERFAQSLARIREQFQKAEQQGDFAGQTAAEKGFYNMVQGKLGKDSMPGVESFFSSRADAGTLDAWKTMSKWQRSGLVETASTEERLVKAAENALNAQKKSAAELEEIKKILNGKNPPPALVAIGWAGGPSKTRQ